MIPPVCPAAQARCEQVGVDAAYTRFARAVRDEFPGVVILDARRSGYGHALFLDATHLDSQGAAALSADVADAVARSLAGRPGGGRWVVLPAFRDRPGPVADRGDRAVPARDQAGRHRQEVVMDGPIGRLAPARLPRGLLGMLALVASIERHVARHPDDFTRTDPANWRFSARSARGPDAKAEILCLGDSLVKFGVQARVVAHATGRRAVNLAVFGGHMPATYFVLEHALRAGARPEAILVDCQDGPIVRDRRRDRPDGLQVNMRSWPELLTVGDCLDLSRTARDAGFFAEVMLAEALPSYKARSEVRDAIAAALRGRGDSWFVTVRALRRNWTQNLGTHVAARSPAPPAAPAAGSGRRRARASSPPRPSRATS